MTEVSRNLMQDGLKATVVSMFPMEICEPKPGLYPGYFVIPAAPIGGMSTLIIGDSVYYQETKNEQTTQVRVAYSTVAESIVNDFMQGHIGRIVEEAEPALFWVPGPHDEASLHKHFQPTIDEKERRQLEWFKQLIMIADDVWSRTRRHTSVSELQRHAARRLSISRPWLLKTSSDDLCKFCKAEVPFGAVKCPNCREIIDFSGYEALMAAQSPDWREKLAAIKERQGTVQ